MKSLESSRRTERRRKQLAGVAGALAGAVLFAVAWSYWRAGAGARRAVHAPVPAKTLPANAEQQLSGYSFTRSIGGRRVFTVHAAKTIAFEPASAGGATVLQDIWVEFFGSRGDRHDVLRTAECKYNPRTGSLVAGGKVDLVLNADSVSTGSGGRESSGNGRPAVFVETSNVSFEQEGSLLVSEEPVTFRVGEANGRARGLQYDIKEGWLELGSEVAADFPLSNHRRSGPSKAAGRHPADEGPAHLTASRLRYDKAKSEISLGGPVAITQDLPSAKAEGKRRVTASEGVMWLDADHRVRNATLTGGVEGRGDLKTGEFRISSPSLEAEFGPEHRIRRLRGEGGVQGEIHSQGRTTQLAAQTLEVQFSGNPSRPAGGTARGNVRMTSTPVDSVGTKGPPSTLHGPGFQQTFNSGQSELTTDRLDFSFQAGGRLIEEARTFGPGTIVLHPSSPNQGERDVTSTPLVMTFDARGQFEGLEGLSRSQITFLPAATARKGTPADVTTSDRFKAVFDPATESLKYLDEFGNVRFREGDRQASAEHARFDPATNAVELRGKPAVWDPATHVRADQMQIDFDDGTFEGEGHVEATHLGESSRGPMTPDAEPTHVVADKVKAERSGGTVSYRGHVRAWHGASVLESAELDISKAQRKISSPARVVTSHLAETRPGPEKEAKAGSSASVVRVDEAQPAVISADRLEYFDEGRKGSYRGNVIMASQGTTVTADALDVFFAPGAKGGESEIERAVASGHVVVARETRRGTGDRAEYWAGEGKIELTGGPPALSQGGEDYVTGRRLTFFLADDTVLVDGDARSPTYSKHRIPQ